MTQYGVRYRFLADRPGMRYTHWESSPEALALWLSKFTHIEIITYLTKEAPMEKEKKLRMTLEVNEGREFMATALKDVALERERQQKKWGEQNRCPTAWVTIVLEELGEATKHALKLDMTAEVLAPEEKIAEVIAYRKEMVETAACAIAAIETIDRAKWTPRELRSRNPGKPEN